MRILISLLLVVLGPMSATAETLQEALGKARAYDEQRIAEGQAVIVTTVDAALANAHEALKTKDIESAYRWIKRAFEIDPDSVDAKAFRKSIEVARTARTRPASTKHLLLSTPAEATVAPTTLDAMRKDHRKEQAAIKAEMKRQPGPRWVESPDNELTGLPEPNLQLSEARYQEITREQLDQIVDQVIRIRMGR